MLFQSLKDCALTSQPCYQLLPRLCGPINIGRPELGHQAMSSGARTRRLKRARRKSFNADAGTSTLTVAIIEAGKQAGNAPTLAEMKALTLPAAEASHPHHGSLAKSESSAVLQRSPPI